MKIYSNISSNPLSSISADQNQYVLVQGNDEIIRKATLTVNGAAMDLNGNITTTLSATLIGPSASGTNNLIASSSGNKTGSIANGTVWIVANDSSVPNPDGQAFIFVSQSTDLTPPAGKWYPLDTLNQTQADLRYVKLVSGTTQIISSSLLISGSTIFTGSLFWSGASSLNGSAGNTVMLGTDGKFYITGSYGGGGGGGGTPGTPLNSIQFNNNSSFGGSANLTFTNTNTVNLTGSLIASGPTPLRVIGSTNISGALFISGTTNLGGPTNNVLVLGSDNRVYTTGSYGINSIKAGSVAPTAFSGNPSSSTITFGTVMANANYGISVIGGDARSWTIDNKTTASFTINSNSAVALTTSASWIAAPANNS